MISLDMTKAQWIARLNEELEGNPLNGVAQRRLRDAVACPDADWPALRRLIFDHENRLSTP